MASEIYEKIITYIQHNKAINNIEHSDTINELREFLNETEKMFDEVTKIGGKKYEKNVCK